MTDIESRRVKLCSVHEFRHLFYLGHGGLMYYRTCT